MNFRFRIIALCLGMLVFAASCVSKSAGAPAPGASVLIFSHTTGYRHVSIDAGRPALKALAEAEGLRVTLSEDPDIFSPENLRRFGAIILLSTTTDPKNPQSEWLTGSRRDAFQDFVRSGGAVVAVHAAADSHYHWPWYGQLIGARFERHPAGTPAGRLHIVDAAHPATRRLPKEHRRADE